MLKTDDIEQLRRAIEEDSIIRDSMADIAILLVSTFEKWLLHTLIACHMADHTERLLSTSTWNIKQ